jgi:hypothetical protein
VCNVSAISWREQVTVSVGLSQSGHHSGVDSGFQVRGAHLKKLCWVDLPLSLSSYQMHIVTCSLHDIAETLHTCP